MTENSSAKRNLFGGPVLIALALLFVAGGVFAFVYFTNPTPVEPEGIMGFRAGIEHQQRMMKLADEYQDADKDMLADAPADKPLNPDTLMFCEIASDDWAKDEAKWKPFIEHLAKVTGKPVKHWRPAPLRFPAIDYAELENASLKGSAGTQSQMNAMKTGDLHIAAFNTGAVTGAVNTAGFHPMYCPANAEGKFGYEMELIVPAHQGITKAEDLKGKTIAFVSMSSNSGCRAGMVYLKSLGLSPGRDYKFLFAGTHFASIKSITELKVDAAFVANDLLKAELNAGKIGPTMFKSIHKSNTFPPLCFGVGNNLDPKLAAKIAEAFETFDKLPAIYPNAPSRVKFAKVDYKKDWAFVREVDEKLATVLDQ